MLSDRVLKTESLSLLKVSKLAKGLEDVIYLNVGEPDFNTPPHIVEAAKRYLDKGYTYYTPDEGVWELREAVAEKESGKGIKVGPNQVLITSGATGAIFAAVMATVNAGDEVLVPDPWYPGFKGPVELAGGRLVGLSQREEEGYNLCPDEANEKITSRTKLMIINSPNNPTGAVYDRDVIKALAEIAVDKNLLVISDEVYEKFIYDGKEFTSIAEFPEMEDKTIVVNSFSKTYAMTGWRVGYAVGPMHIIESMTKITCATTFCATSISQYAALAALKGPQNCVKEMVDEYDKRRKLVLKKLNDVPKISFVKPSGSLYIFPKIEKTNMSSEDLVKFLIKNAKVVTSPGYPYFGPGGKQHIRISYTVRQDRLKEALERIKDAMEHL